MPARAERRAAAEGAEGGGVAALDFGGRVVGVRGGRKEAIGVEGRCIGAPDGGVVVHHVAGHVDDGVLLEEVAVLEEGVLQDDAHGGVVAAGAKDFLEGGVQEGAGGEEFSDVEGGGRWVRGG